MSKGLLVGWHNIKLFAAPPARRGSVNKVAPSFWQELDGFIWYLVATPFCFSYFSRLLASDDVSLTSRMPSFWLCWKPFFYGSVPFFRQFASMLYQHTVH